MVEQQQQLPLATSVVTQEVKIRMDPKGQGSIPSKTVMQNFDNVVAKYGNEKALFQKVAKNVRFLLFSVFGFSFVVCLFGKVAKKKVDLFFFFVSFSNVRLSSCYDLSVVFRHVFLLKTKPIPKNKKNNDALFKNATQNKTKQKQRVNHYQKQHGQVGHGTNIVPMLIHLPKHCYRLDTNDLILLILLVSMPLNGSLPILVQLLPVVLLLGSIQRTIQKHVTI